MKEITVLRVFALILMAMTMFAACGGGDDDDAADSPSAPTTTLPASEAVADATSTATTATTARAEPTVTPVQPTPTVEPVAATVGQWVVVEAWTPANTDVIGELLNDSAQEVLRPEVSVALYNAAGTLLGSSSSCFVSHRIAPGGVGGFQCAISGAQASDVADTRITVEKGFARPDSPEAAAYITTVSILQTNWLPAGITGEFRNDGDIAIDANSVMALLYDTAGELYAMVTGFSDVDTIAPGLTSTFTVGGISELQEPADMRIVINTRVNTAAAASAPTATADPAVPTVAPTSTPALDVPDGPLAVALPPLTMFPAGWTVEYPDTPPTGENTFCDVAPMSLVTTIEEQVEGEYTASNGFTFLSVSVAQLEDSESALEFLINGATCTEWENDGATWQLREMSFPEVGDGPQWVRAATVATDGAELAVEIVAFLVDDVMVLVGHVGLGSVDTDLTVQVTEYVVDALD